jgi:hypothetical protein
MDFLSYLRFTYDLLILLTISLLSSYDLLIKLSIDLAYLELLSLLNANTKSNK